ncbi:hypothetical protein G6F22_015693 [Rhizopus arrhizus]|nr:hypothetical protein G6F22_015693 [Rhizopus arrhizus]
MQTPHPVVSRPQWDAAREALLVREKAMTRAQDALARDRLDLPWVRVDKPYQFQSAGGPRGLADLFDGKLVWFGLQGFIKEILIDLFDREFFGKPAGAAVHQYQRRAV